MKILLVNNYHYKKGGSETVYLETGKLLEENGHEVCYFSVKDQEITTKINAHLVESVDYSSGNFLSKIKNTINFIYSKRIAEELDSFILKEKPEIAHLHIFYGRLTSSILPILNRHKIPVIMTVHEYRMLCPVYTFLDGQGILCNKCANYNYFFCIINKCNKNNLFYSFVSSLECYVRDIFFSYEKYISRFIMVSRFSATLHVKYRPKLVEKVSQIYNFINLTAYTPRVDHDGYCLYFGRLSGEKGVKTLLDAWINFSDIPLKIVGTGPLLKFYVEYADQLGIKNVEFCGFIDGEKLKNVISGARFVLVPSEWYENNPMTIIESFSLGKPVIGANIGGIPELVDDGKTGLLFTSRDINSLVFVIKKALDMSREEYECMSINCRLFAEKTFDKSDYYKKLINEYRAIIL